MNGDATIRIKKKYYKNKKIKSVEFYNQFGLNNEKGPAKIEYDQNGNITNEIYSISGKCIFFEEYKDFKKEQFRDIIINCDNIKSLKKIKLIINNMNINEQDLHELNELIESKKIIFDLI